MNKVFKRIRNIFALMLAVVVAVSSAAGGFGMLDTYAASKKAAKKITLSASAADEYTVSLSWNKIKSPQKGYAVFRNGHCIARLGKKKTSFTDYVDAGSTNTYTIKRWKSKGKGKKKKFKYSKASNSVSVTTPGYSRGAVNTSENSSGTKLSQSINYYGDRVMTVGGNPYRLGGSASSGLPVTYTSQNPAVATVDSSGLVRAVSPGIAIIYIRQAGDATYNPAERQAKITVTGSQNPGQGTDPGTGSGADPDPGTDPNPGTTTDPAVVTGEFKINIPASMQTSDGRVINLNMGEVEIPITMPAHVAKIVWTESSGRAGSNDTITHRTTDNGKRLYLTAENALNNYGAFGQVQYTARLTMEDGYTYYYDNNNDGAVDEKDSTRSFIITNTIYPTTGSFTDKTYNSRDMNPEIVRPGLTSPKINRVISLNAESLPNGSTINININEFNANSGFEAELLFPTMSDSANRDKLELVRDGYDPNWECIVFKSRSLAIKLLKTGSFKMKFPDGKIINFNIEGSNPETLEYYERIKEIGNICRVPGDELATIKNCIRYSLMNYTYSMEVQDMHGRRMGDCITSNSYFCEVLKYCGIKAFVRIAALEQGGYHHNMGVVLKDGTKYIVDCTPGNPISEDEIDSWTTDYQLQKNSLVPWDTYYERYGGQVDFNYDDDEFPMIKEYY